jgi:hypothetical protein
MVLSEMTLPSDVALEITIDQSGVVHIRDKTNRETLLVRVEDFGEFTRVVQQANGQLA